MARKGQYEGGGMGQTWCRPSCLKEPHQAGLWSPRAPCGCSSGLPDGKRVLGTSSCSKHSHAGTSRFNSGLYTPGPARSNGLPSHPLLPIPSIPPTQLLAHSSSPSFNK